jgi:protein-disulfide isomerase
MSKLSPPVSELDNQITWPRYWITLVEYGDYECPYCGHAYPIVKDILKEWDYEIRFVFRNFPLAGVHPHAISAAVAAEAAARQTRFWDMHDALFENQKNFTDDTFAELAQNLGLQLDKFQNDFTDASTLKKVNLDFKSGLVSGVNGTPTFFIDGEKLELKELTYDALNDVIEERMIGNRQDFPLL